MGIVGTRRRQAVGLVAGLALFAVIGAHASVAGAAETVAFVDVNVLTMADERVLARQTVVVSDGRIAAIGPVSEVAVPEGARRVDGGGRAYLMPGLADMHVHLRRGSESWLPLFVANGVTTVLNMHGTPKHLEMRRAVVGGRLLGPTIYTTGPQIGKYRPLSPDDARRLVIEHAAAGYDFVKVYSYNPGAWTREAYDAVLSAARAHGIAVTGHAPRNLPFEAVLDAGDQSIGHAEELLYTGLDALDEARIPGFAERAGRAGLWLVTSFGMFEGIQEQWGRPEAAEKALNAPTARYLPRGIRHAWGDDNPYTWRREGGDWIARAYRYHFPLLGALHRAGVRLMTGSDAPVAVQVPGFSIFRDIELLVEAGLTRYQALEAATRTPGDFITAHVDPNEAFGRVSPGYRADLLLVEGNPLEDLGNLRRRVGVMARGRWYTAAALQARLDEMAAAFAKPPEMLEDATGERLVGDRIGATLGGRTLTAVDPKGDRYRYALGADGRVTGVSGPIGDRTDAGQWWVKKNELCLRWDNWWCGRKRCHAVVMDGETITWFLDVGGWFDTHYVKLDEFTLEAP